MPPAVNRTAALQGFRGSSVQARHGEAALLQEVQDACLAGQVAGADGDEGCVLFHQRQHTLDHDQIAIVEQPLVEAFRRLERSEEHTSELQSLMRISYAVFCLKKKTTNHRKKYTSVHATTM